MKKLATLALALSLAACGQEPEKPKPLPQPVVDTTPKPPPIPNDPNGKYACLTCKIKTNDKTCPGCKVVLASEETRPATTGGTEKPGTSTAGACYGCGNEKCKWTSPNKSSACMDCNNKCEKEVWYACAACNSQEAASGKCPKCKGDLKKTFK
jgi:hypothetical protein